MSVVHSVPRRSAAGQRALAQRSGDRMSESRQAPVRDRNSVPWAQFADDYDRIRDSISRMVPGLIDFNARVRQPDGSYCRTRHATSAGSKPPSGRANFIVDELDSVPVPPAADPADDAVP